MLMAISMKDRSYHRVIGKAGCLFPMKNIYLANFLIAAWTNCRNLLGMIRVVKRTETFLLLIKVFSILC